MAAGLAVAADRVLAGFPARLRPGLLSLLRAAAGGAGAAFLRELLHPLLHDQPADTSRPIVDEEALLDGAARGLVYGSVVQPRLGGPQLLRGALYGSVEYAVSPLGGLGALLGDRLPAGRLGVLSRLAGNQVLGEDTFLDHVVFGLALALLYRPDGSDSKIGTVHDE